MLDYMPIKAPAPRAVSTVLTTFLVVEVFTGSAWTELVSTVGVAVISVNGSVVLCIGCTEAMDRGSVGNTGSIVS